MILHLTILIQIWDDLGRDIQTVFCLDPWAWAMLQVASPWRLEAARPWQWWTASEGQFRWMAEDLAWFHKNLLSRAHRWDISISIYICIYGYTVCLYYSLLFFYNLFIMLFAFLCCLPRMIWLWYSFWLVHFTLFIIIYLLLVEWEDSMN